MCIISNSALFFLLLYVGIKYRLVSCEKSVVAWIFSFKCLRFKHVYHLHLHKFGCGPWLLLTSIHIVIMWCSFIFIWLVLFLWVWCVCLTKDLPLLFYYIPHLLLAHSFSSPLFWGRDNCVMVCSLSGSRQATVVFSQSRHLLCCAALFNSDVMSCGKSTIQTWCTGEGRGWAVIRDCGGGDFWVRGLCFDARKEIIWCNWGHNFKFFSHKDKLCVSLRPNKHVKCSSFHINICKAD